MKRKIVLLLMIIIFIIGLNDSIASLTNTEKNNLISDAQSEKQRIMAQCIEDPYDCPCESIPCNQIKGSDDPDASRAYERCTQEVDYCMSERKKAIQEMEKKRKEIESLCRNDFSKCDCSSITSQSGRKECEVSVANAKKEAQEEMEKKRKEIESLCRKDMSRCDCSSIENDEGKKECENAVIEARYLAQKERDDMIRKCHDNIVACDCDSIENEAGRIECQEKLGEAKEFREKIESSCRTNPLVCDCAEIENSAGREECEREKKEAFNEASSKVKTALSRCFKDVDNCDCRNIGIPEEYEDSIEFCEVQKNYGLSCKYEGVYCEKLDEVEIYPPGMPSWLGTYFSQEYSNYINKEKEKGTREAGRIIAGCINDPESCECDKSPDYAHAFCERMKSLQLRCYNDEDYSACMMLEDSKNLPEGMPYFMIGTIDSMIQSLRDAREKIVKGRASKKVGDMILNCIDDTSYCDCSIAPTGQIKAFCQHKIDLVKRCKDNKDFDSCFTLDEEPITDDVIPDFVKIYIERKVAPKIIEKKQAMFNEMKINTVCEDAKTIPECKKIYEKEILKK
jgi:hypothetical protein